MERPQFWMWKMFALLAVAGGASLMVGWGVTAALVWVIVFGVLAVLTYKGVINPVVILLLLPTGVASAQEVDVSAGWFIPGVLTGEPTNHVRVDPTVFTRTEVAFMRTETWGGYLATYEVSSFIHIWPAGEGRESWFDFRRVGGQAEPINWRSLAVGGIYRNGDFSVNLGGAAVILTSTSTIQGASPTTSVHLDLAGRWMRPVHDRFYIGIFVWAQPALLYGHEWIRHWGAMEFGDDDTHRTRGNLVVPSGVGLNGRLIL